MIFTFQSSQHPGSKAKYMVFDSSDAAWEAYKMLDSAFPYNQETYINNSWDFHICSYGQYENAISFPGT
jgi:hypothetical protein